MIGNARAHGRAVAASFERLSLTMPKPVTLAFARRDRIIAGASHLGSSAGLAEAVVQSLATGKDPAGDPEVVRILTSGQLSAVAAGVEQAAELELAGSLAANADTIITVMRKVFDQASGTLTEAHTVIGSVPLEDTGSILAKGPAAATAWAEAQRAVGTIDSLEGCWFSLASVSGIDPDRRHRVLRIADVPPATFLDDNLTEVKLTAWQIVSAGLTLKLPSLTEYRGRVQAVFTEQDRRQAEHERRQKAQLKAVPTA